MKKAHFVDSILTIWALIFTVLLLFGFGRLAFIVNQCRSVSRHAYITCMKKMRFEYFNCFHSFPRKNGLVTETWEFTKESKQHVPEPPKTVKKPKKAMKAMKAMKSEKKKPSKK